MRFRDVIKLVAGSCAVYFVIAACSAYSEEERGGGSNNAFDGDAPKPASPVPNALAEGHKSGTRLKLRFWEGTDGARQFINFFDTELKTPCTVGSAKTVDGKSRCLPTLVGYLVYSDVACKTRAGFVVSKTIDPQPRIGGVTDNKGLTDYFQLGALANPPTGGVFAGDEQSAGGPGGCKPASIDPANASYYPIAAPLAPTAFVEMTVNNE